MLIFSWAYENPSEFGPQAVDATTQNVFTLLETNKDLIADPSSNYGFLSLQEIKLVVYVLGNGVITIVPGGTEQFFNNVGASKQNPNPPEHSPPDTSKSPPPITNPPVTVTSAPDAPTQIPLPPLPPYNNLPATPNSRYVLPDVGRTDLCRAWAYSLNSEARPSSSDGRPTDRLVYTIPSIAPIYIETSAICPTSGGLNKRCTEYDDSRDVISGKLNVIGGDVELPTVEIFLQHGSELGLEDLAVCLMQQPLSAEER
ncbi:hypothetical protein FRC07_000814, partial [Ceratobasidium sp. 392]